MREVHYEAGETIVREGDPSNYCYHILSGSVEIRLKQVGVASAARQMDLDELVEGEVFGEMSIIDQGPHSATVVAKTPTTCAAYTRDEFLELLRQNPDDAFEMIVMLVQRLRKTNRKLLQAMRRGH